ncbi:MAG: winged helix-turn-helix transcriptional regulator [Pelagibacterales bacterium]|nr:winged helix-turn-helix transcriptional regulator [Pelagibacterales bacterium]
MLSSNLRIYGSEIFYRLIYDLNLFNKVYIGKSFISEENTVLVVFPKNLSTNFLEPFYKSNLPIIFISDIKEKSLDIGNINNFSVFLKAPIEVQNFLEISKILISKFNFLKASRILIKDYDLNSNTRSIEKKKQKLKLTEIEVKLILFMNESKGFSKEEILENVWQQRIDLDTHAFETCLHRLRKKMKDKFNDENFIYLKNKKYFLL